MQDHAVIVFVMSYACPLKCSFCCHTREVVGRARLKAATIVEYMTRFAVERGVERFCFTGGEPFQYIDDIKDAVRDARAMGVQQPFHIVTSANWVDDHDQTLEMMSDLQALGMDLIGVSYDHEHAKWVRAEQIRTLCEIAASLSIKVNLNGVFWHVNESVDELIQTNELPGEVRVRSYLAVPAGRAKKASAWPRHYDVPNETKYTCGEPGSYHVTIYPDGEVYPCCSGGMNIEAKLSCGNLNRDTPESVLRNVFTSFHVRMVKEFGWGSLFEFISRENPELARRLPRFEDVDSVCEMCRDLNVNWAKELAPLYEKFEIEYVRTRAEYDWKALTKASGAAERRWLGDKLLSMDEMTELLSTSSESRANYLAGSLRIDAGGPLDRNSARPAAPIQ